MKTKNIILCFFTFFLFSPSTLFAQRDSLIITLEGRPEKEASYPGGAAAWQQYLKEKLDNFDPESLGVPEGVFTVTVRFIINKDGSITKIEPVTHLGYGLEEEVMKIIASSGRWEPATQNSRKVNAYRRQNITFEVDHPRFDILCDDAYFLKSGVPNELEIWAKGFVPGDLRFSVSNGEVTKRRGKSFTVVTNAQPGERVEITITHKREDIGEIGKVSFEIKPAY